MGCLGWVIWMDPVSSQRTLFIQERQESEKEIRQWKKRPKRGKDAILLALKMDQETRSES